VQWVATVVEPHGIVEEREQEDDERVGAGRAWEEGEPCRGDTLPVAYAVYGGLLARGFIEDGVHEFLDVRYGDVRI
jgi:hypothetical protein